MHEEDDLTPPPGAYQDDPAPMAITHGQQEEFRGVGAIFKRKPIAAVVEILRRAPDKTKPGKWTFVRPFIGIPEGSEVAFNIMQSVPTTTNQRGQPVREPHPAFEQFNTCHPEQARTLRARIINWNEVEAYKNFLGCYKPPDGKGLKAPEKGGYWCSGDAVRARRFVNGEFKSIPCPNRLCEFSQEGSGPRGQGTHCKPHIELIAQFNWRDGSPLPRVLFEWDSQSWNNVANIEGMFGQINDLAEKLGYKSATFPIINLCFTMNLKERIKSKKKFPEVSFSVDDDLMKFMQGNHQLALNEGTMRQAQIEGPRPLGELPPPGYTQEQMRSAKDATLRPVYEPKNVRDA